MPNETKPLTRQKLIDRAIDSDKVTILRTENGQVIFTMTAKDYGQLAGEAYDSGKEDGIEVGREVEAEMAQEQPPKTDRQLAVQYVDSLIADGHIQPSDISYPVIQAFTSEIIDEFIKRRQPRVNLPMD